MIYPVGETGDWIGFYQVEREGRTLIVHSYEIIDKPGSHGYEVFQWLRNGSFELLHESEPRYVNRKNALLEGKDFAEEYRFIEEEARQPI